MKLRIQCVSAYAFSIENFKRSPEEVEALMELAENKLLELCQHGCVVHFSHPTRIPDAALVTCWTNTVFG
jgi:undecaprenyl diphosphate synthase